MQIIVKVLSDNHRRNDNDKANAKMVADLAPFKLVQIDLDNEEVDFDLSAYADHLDKDKEVKAIFNIENNSIEEELPIEVTEWGVHGTDSGNLLSLLSTGLKVENAHNGMFGKGIYHARLDQPYKAQFHGSEFQLINQIDMGNPLYVDNFLKQGDDVVNSSSEYDSLWYQANPNANQTRLGADELVVYNDTQVMMRYLVQLGDKPHVYNYEDEDDVF